MPLSTTDRILLRLSVGVVLGRWDLVREMRRSAGSGEPDRAWREAVLQTHLFAGFPRLVEAYAVLVEEGGLGEVHPDEFPGEPDRPDRGRELFDRIYGTQSETVRHTLQSYHADFAFWIEGHVYGRVLTRPGLSVARRELLAVACLAALGQDRQLVSHARGALRCGVPESDVWEALECIQDMVDERSMAHACRVLERLAMGSTPNT